MIACTAKWPCSVGNDFCALESACYTVLDAPLRNHLDYPQGTLAIAHADLSGLGKCRV